MSISLLAMQITRETERAKFASLQMYINKKFSDLSKGYCELDDTDLFYIQFSKLKSKIFLDRLYYHSGSSDRNLIKEARKACGYPTDSLHSDEISKKRVFVVTQKALDAVEWKYSTHSKPKENVSSNSQNRAKIVALFANFLGANIKKLVCTSTKREVYDQFVIVYGKFQKKAYNSYFKTYIRVKTEYDQYEKNPNFFKTLEPSLNWKDYIKPKIEQAIKDLKKEDPINNFRHVDSDGDTFDIGPGESNFNTIDMDIMIKSMKQFRSTNFIKSQSLYYMEIEDELAFHFVIS
ncbi:MAG: hypothetical protein ACRCS8_00355 [Brevinema sp.]